MTAGNETAAEGRMKECAAELAAASGEIIRRYFDCALDVEAKADSSPVTAADRRAEQAMREIVAARFPDHGILGEEYGAVNPEAEYVWVFDPIDGTRSFVQGGLDFGTLIALLKGGEPVLGVISHPILGHYLEGDGESCFFNGSRVSVRDCGRIEDAVCLTTDLLAVGRHQNGPAFEALARRVRMLRTWGNCFAYSLLARGLADIAIDPIMAKWDLLALIPVVRGAGGVITDYQGGGAVDGNSIVAAAPAIHAAVVASLNGRGG